MKAVYITSQDMTDSTSGVNKKIRMQISAFSRLGVDMDIPDLAAHSWTDKIVRRLPFIKNEFEKKLKNYIVQSNFTDVDFVYIRHPMVSWQFVQLLKKIKKTNNRIVYEFPTFPYDRNSKKFAAIFSLLKDKISRGKLHKYVDIGVDYSGFKEIYSIPCLCLSNGIDISMISTQNDIKNDDNTVRFIGVALLANWNGYDRLILAIKKYLEEKNALNVEFHIVGNGDVFYELKRLIVKNNLENVVFLHGFLSGKKLDNLYDMCDIGVGTLNPSRKYKNHIMSSLKTKEYAAKGMPFIKGDIDSVFDEKSPDFVFNVLDDESEIRLKDIVQWYMDLMNKYGRKQLGMTIREFAKNELSWDNQMKVVINYLEKCMR